MISNHIALKRNPSYPGRGGSEPEAGLIFTVRRDVIVIKESFHASVLIPSRIRQELRGRALGQWLVLARLCPV